VGEPVMLRVEPSSSRFDASDDRWIDQTTGLVGELREVGDVDLARAPGTGTKGATAEILLSLTSAGVLTATVELLRAWLSRDRSRSVKLSWDEEGELRDVELSGDDLDDAAFDRIIGSVAGRLGPA
jgi:hypothetical protein